MKAFHNGKKHLAIAISLKALHAGYTVCFERMGNLVRLLKTGDLQRSTAFRINRILRGDVLIIDQIGYTAIDRKEANLFFNLVSELYERSPIIITSNKAFGEWAEIMGDETMNDRDARRAAASRANLLYEPRLVPGCQFRRQGGT